MHSLQYTWLQLGNWIQVTPNLSQKQTLQVWLAFTNISCSATLSYSFNTSRRSPSHWLSDTALESNLKKDRCPLVATGDCWHSERPLDSLEGFTIKYDHERSKVQWIWRNANASYCRNCTHSNSTTCPFRSSSHCWSSFWQSFDNWNILINKF